MTLLTNSRHERFAQALAAGKSADEAYQEAGFRENRGNASRLKANESIQARVTEIQSRATEGVQISRQWVIERLVENVQRAMQAEAPSEGAEYKYDGSVANRALELLGKELGMFVDRSENVNTVFELSDTLPTAEEWEAENATAH